IASVPAVVPAKAGAIAGRYGSMTRNPSRGSVGPGLRRDDAMLRDHFAMICREQMTPPVRLRRMALRVLPQNAAMRGLRSAIASVPVVIPAKAGIHRRPIRVNDQETV